MLPKEPPSKVIRRSTVGFLQYDGKEAISEEDLICEYSDSLRLIQPQPWDFLPRHNDDALGISVRQSSYGWSHQYLEDFIIVELTVRNEGTNVLRDAYLGLHILPYASLGRPYQMCGRENGLQVFGLMRKFQSLFGCDHQDSLSVAWSANASGAPYEGEWLEGRDEWIFDPIKTCHIASARHVLGVMPLRAPASDLPLRYNWFGTASGYTVIEATQDSDVPAFQNNSPYLYYDDRLYRLLTTDEVDFPSYKIAEVNIDQLSPWNPIAQFRADEAALGFESVHGVLSWGPVTLTPGAEVPLTFAIVGGENLHVDPDNYLNLPHNPYEYESNLDFSDLHQNALMAQWLYDNPGIDTDGDGYKGEFRVCVRDSMLVNGEWVVNKADTQWYKGDGIPDYRGALPPPAPEFWLTSTLNGVHVRFNGQVTETEKDIFLQKPDFEGYRVYLGRDERESSLQLVGSYDLEDYDKYYLDLTLEQPTWQLEGEPYSKEELRCLYGQGAAPCEDSTFEPLGFTQLRPYRHPDFPNDSVFWFKKHEYNASEFGVNTPIKKRFPNMPDPRTLPADSITDDMYTEDGYLKFYEYEMTIENLLPTVEYWVNVTAFDYGSPAQGVNPLETERTDGVRPVYPLTEHDAPISGSEQVYVYPNPYRVDANYRADGYEGRNQDDRWDERVRAIWFANLPPVCTIHIYTIDGDRVRTMDHTSTSSDPTHRRKQWDLINRNFQKVETGLYYWVVEVPGGRTQMGKLVIIR